LSKKLIDVKFEGNKHKAQRVEFESDKEPWNIYKLSDDTTLRMKTVVTDIVKLTTTHRPDGEPIYLVKSANLVEADAPEHLYTKAHKDQDVN